jgi:hypothetical protein
MAAMTGRLIRGLHIDMMTSCCCQSNLIRVNGLSCVPLTNINADSRCIRGGSDSVAECPPDFINGRRGGASSRLRLPGWQHRAPRFSIPDDGIPTDAAGMRSNKADAKRAATHPF